MTLTVQDFDNGKRDLETVSAVSNSRDPNTGQPIDSYSTRLGDTVKTLNKAISDIEAGGAEAIAGLGYAPLGDGIWAAGKTFTSYNQYLVYSEATYKVKASTPLPYGPIGAAPDLNDVEAFDGSLLFAEKCRFSKLDNPLCQIFSKNAIVKNINGSLSFTRDSAAQYLDRYGILRTSSVDEPRSGEDGWLIESTSTNYCLYSDRQDNPAYLSTGTVTLAPSENLGSLTPSKFVPSSDLSIKNIPSQDFTPVIGENVITYVIKAAEYGDVIQFGSTSTWSPVAGFQLCKVNFRTGEVITGAQYVSQIKPIGNGYWLFAHKFVAEVQAASKPTAQLHSNDNQQSWQPDGVGGIYIAFVQYEQNSYSSSLISTSGSPATRLADTAAIPAMDNTPRTNSFSFAAELIDINYSIDFPVLFRITYQGALLFFLSTDDSEKYYVGALNQNDTTDYAISDTVHVPGERRFFVVTITDDFIRFYIDGKLAKETAATASRKEILDLNQVELLFVSKFNRGSVQYNDLRLYDFALNQAEVTFLSGTE